jgi:hypothetical protein
LPASALARFFNPIQLPNGITMEKRVLGIILSLLGIVGLILAAIFFINGGHGEKGVKMIFTYALLGLIFFFAGIGLVRSTRDKAS